MRRTFAILLLLVGCTSYSRPYPAPSPQEVLAATSSSITSIRASGTVDYLGKEGRYKGRAFLLADRLGHLRFEVISPPPMNATILLVTSDGTSVKVWNSKRNEFYEGDVRPCVIEAFLGVPATPSQLFGYITGSVPKGTNPRLSWDSSHGYEVLTVERDGVLWRYLVLGREGRKGWRVMAIRAALAGGKLRVDYKGHQRTRFGWLPGRVRIRYRGSDIVFRWTRREVNIQLPEEAFDQDVPEGATVKRVVCTEE